MPGAVKSGNFDRKSEWEALAFAPVSLCFLAELFPFGNHTHFFLPDLTFHGGSKSGAKGKVRVR